MSGERKAKSRRALHWMLWWQIDPEEVDVQVREYKTRTFLRSSRGVGAGLLLLSVIITVVLAALRLTGFEGLIDAALLLVLAVFVYLGHRWAMIGAMILWTIEKALQIIGGLNGAGAGGGAVVFHLIWWCIYMHAFFLAFRVEQARKSRDRLAADAPSVFD